MPRSHSRSPPPSRRRRSPSPPPRDRDRDRDRRDPTPHSSNRDRRPPPPPPPSRDVRRDNRGGGGAKYDSRDDRRRSRSRSPARRGGGGGGGDAGWGRGERDRQLSPGRPSLALASGSGSGGGRGEKGPLPSQEEMMGKAGVEGGQVEKVKAVEPNFGLSGALAAETNTFNGVVLKYSEPPEARKPVRSWRLYVFKGKEQVDLFHVNKQSAYLFGRDRIVADIPIDHPSTSKQHAVLQFRQIMDKNEFGDSKTLTKPFVIDLDSANGTTVNDETVPTSRYYELKTGDVLKFAFSSREYVLLAES